MNRRVAVVALLLWMGCSNDSSSTTDAGTSDLAAPPADDMATSGSCPYKYCEDFESYGGAITNAQSLGPWIASVSASATDMGTSMVTASVDSVNASHGSKSLHITVTKGPGAHATLNQKAAAGLVPGNDLYGRAMVYYSNTNGNGLPLGVHSWVFNASGPAARDGGIGSATMNMGGGGSKLQLNYHPPTGGESSVQGGMITAGAWHCLQWQYDGPNNTANVWIDGAPAVTVPASKGWELAMPWDSFDFGFTHYQVLGNSVEIFLDDFALDGAMVPCP